MIDAAQTPWLEVNAVIPDYAGSPTPAATYSTPFWLSAGAFSSGSVYLDPCDDDPLINVPTQGFAWDSFYLPLLEQAERTLTPTYTPTVPPVCRGVINPNNTGDSIIRDGPDGTEIARLEAGIAIEILAHTSGSGEWQLIETDEGIQPYVSGWISSSLTIAYDYLWACQNLPEYNLDGTPEPTRGGFKNKRVGDKLSG